MKHYRLLDYIRLFLAASVVFNHLSAYKVPFQPVPAFLALSGFLVLQSYEASESWIHFAWKRFLRIVPAFIVGLVLCFAAWGWAGVLGTLNCYLTLGLRDGIYNHAVWSLEWEELFYLLLALLFAAGVYRSKGVVWCCFLLGAAIPLALVEAFHPPVILVLASPLAAAFFAGNLCYLYRDSLPRFRWTAIAGVGVGLIVPVPIFAAAIFGASLVILGVGFGQALPKIRDYSYSCYLYHVPLSAMFGAWTLPVLGVACALSEWLVEKPALKWKKCPPNFLTFRKRRVEVLDPS